MSSQIKAAEATVEGLQNQLSKAISHLRNEILGYHKLVPDETRVKSPRTGATYVVTGLYSSAESGRGKPWIRGRQVLKDGSLHKRVTCLFSDWEII